MFNGKQFEDFQVNPLDGQRTRTARERRRWKNGQKTDKGDHLHFCTTKIDLHTHTQICIYIYIL